MKPQLPEVRLERTLDLKTPVDMYEMEVMVSTVSLSIDHRYYRDDGPPLWYETMIFPSKDGEVTDYGELFCYRYTTEQQARDGHRATVLACQTLGMKFLEQGDE